MIAVPSIIFRHPPVDLPETPLYHRQQRQSQSKLPQRHLRQGPQSTPLSPLEKQRQPAQVQKGKGQCARRQTARQARGQQKFRNHGRSQGRQGEYQRMKPRWEIPEDQIAESPQAQGEEGAAGTALIDGRHSGQKGIEKGRYPVEADIGEDTPLEQAEEQGRRPVNAPFKNNILDRKSTRLNSSH